MNKIILISDVVKEKMNECVEAGGKQFMASIRPIYGSTNSGVPLHIGTCTLIEVAQNKYIVSAAHVFDENQYSSLYFGSSSELEPLEGNIFSTQNVDGKRSNDHFDFAWMKIPQKLLSKLNNVNFISENDIANGKENSKGRFYLALGYPNSKNRKINILQKSVKPMYFKYGATVQSNIKLCQKLNISGNQHLFLNYDLKGSRNSDGNKVASIKPTGISGGGLIDMGIFASTDKLLPDVSFVGKLAGILIENHKAHKAISAIKINVIVDQIKKMS